MKFEGFVLDLRGFIIIFMQSWYFEIDWKYFKFCNENSIFGLSHDYELSP